MIAAMLVFVALVACDPGTTTPGDAADAPPGDAPPGDDDTDPGDDDDTDPDDTGPTDTAAADPCLGQPAECADCNAAGYWATTRGLAGLALEAELHELSGAQRCVDYSADTTFMFVVLDKVDGSVTCVYTGRTVAVGNEKPDPNDMNTEHTWPRSLGAEDPPAECDLHHLFPTDSDANNSRANYPFGEVVAITTPWGPSALGRDAAGATVFEPRDEHKGNVSRAMLYFAMRYGYPIEADQLALYRAWSAADPVDDAERARTFAIAERQGVANPYVVCPSMVDLR